MLSPRQICTYIADQALPWEYAWIEFDGLRAKEIIEIAGLTPDAPVVPCPFQRPQGTYAGRAPVHRQPWERVPVPSHRASLSVHRLSVPLLRRDAPSGEGRVRDFYIKEALAYIEQNFQNDIFRGRDRRVLWVKPELFRTYLQRYDREIPSGNSHELSDGKGNRTFKADRIPPSVTLPMR